MASWVPEGRSTVRRRTRDGRRASENRRTVGWTEVRGREGSGIERMRGEGLTAAEGAEDREHPVEFRKALGLFDSIMIVAGIMVGSGIFIVSAEISRQVGSAGWLMVAWAITGVLTFSAALSYGELAAMMPRAGGDVCVPA